MSDRFDDGFDRLRVGIDMDGVVADFNSSWMDRYNGDFGASLEVSQVTTWNGLHRLTHFETMDHFWEWARGDGHSIFRDAPPMPGAIESLGRIGRAHRLVIVSPCPPSPSTTSPPSPESRSPTPSQRGNVLSRA